MSENKPVDWMRQINFRQYVILQILLFFVIGYCSYALYVDRQGYLETQEICKDYERVVRECNEQLNNPIELNYNVLDAVPGSEKMNYIPQKTLEVEEMG